MVAKIGKGSNMYGAILYNQQKVEKKNGAVLLLNKMPDTMNGKYVCQYPNGKDGTAHFVEPRPERQGKR
jgi:hypothetical protein